MATITRGRAPLSGVTKFRVALLSEIDTMFASRPYSKSLSTCAEGVFVEREPDEPDLRGYGMRLHSPCEMLKCSRPRQIRTIGDKPFTLPKLPHAIPISSRRNQGSTRHQAPKATPQVISDTYR